jgi:hypothetical protein
MEARLGVTEHQPFGVITSERDADLLDPSAIVLLLGPAGSVSVWSDDSRALKFLCYFAKLFDFLPVFNQPATGAPSR